MTGGLSKRQMLQYSESDVEYLARLYDLRIEREDMPEVVSRLNALLEEAEKLNDLDLSQVEPIPIFVPKERG